ncbi:hypothetical protein HanRHA438_Chr00c41g0856941 [Helianthus annuus]|nr:hypothetical protein HanRHA438_Chr00c41g0856941 [Helianthus annuus]
MSAYSPSPMRGQSPDDEKLALEFFVPFLILLTLLAFWYYRRNRSTRIINSSRPFYSGSGSSSSSTVLPASVVKSCPLYTMRICPDVLCVCPCLKMVRRVGF